jgi:hypothetical protein
MQNAAMKKSWLTRLLQYKNTIGGTLVISVLLGNFWISNFLNPVPQQSELRTYSVTITQSYLRGPHFLATNSDGVSQAFLLPRPFDFTGKGSYYPGVSPETQKSWTGCQAIVQGLPVKFSLADQVRVWSLKCKDYELTFDELNKNFIKYQENISVLSWLAYLLFSLMLWICYRGDRRVLSLTKS